MMNNIMKMWVMMIVICFLALTQTNSYSQEVPTPTTDEPGILSDDKNTQAYEETASALASDLQTKINLTEDQTNEIRDILVSYTEEIADIKKAHHGKHGEMMGEKRTEGEETPGTETETDEQMVGGQDDMINSYREADEDANSQIENTLEENQLEQYMQLKRDWWNSVKDQVHSVTSMKGTMKENMEKMETDENKIK